jgi:hypothetical protein
MQFKLKIGSDFVNFINIETTGDKTLLPVHESDTAFLNVLLSSPSIVEITNLSYNPQEDSIWNGTDFIDLENREVRPLAKSSDGFKKFAFVVDNKYKLFYGILDDPKNEMIIAMLSSNPEVVIG